MSQNYRQKIILFDLLSQDGPLDYDHFTNILEVTKRTIREDVRVINDEYKDDLHISFKKNEGFFLEISDEKKEKMIRDMKGRYTDIFDASLSLSKNSQSILLELFTANDYVKVDKLTNKLFVNKRTITNILGNIRKQLEPYELKLVSRPHYGMFISGEEVKYRCCCVDIFYNSLSQRDFTDAILVKIKEVENIITDYFITIDKEIAQSALLRLALMILVSYDRIVKKHEVEFNDEQNELLDRLIGCIDLSGLIDKLEHCLDLRYSSDEKKWVMLVVTLECLNLIEENYDKLADDKSDELTRGVYDLLDKLYVIGSSDSSYLDKYLKADILRLYLIAKFNIYNNCLSASSVNTITQSGLSIAITDRIISYIGEKLDFHYGNSSFFRSAFLVYSLIRSINNIGRKVNIAVYTPFGKINSRSLKRRIENSWLEVIDKIDCLSYNDLFSKKIYEYDHLVYSDCLLPDIDLKQVKPLQVDYLFTNEDSHHFYEEVVIPSRIYHRAFSTVYIEDYIYDHKYTSLNNLKKLLKENVTNNDILSQIDALKITLGNLHHGSLTWVVFCKDKKDTFSKLIYLNNYAKEDDYKFNRIFFHCIALERDLISVKTAEKVIRNIITFICTDDTINRKPYIDFYEYYISNSFNYISNSFNKLGHRK